MGGNKGPDKRGAEGQTVQLHKSIKQDDVFAKLKVILSG